jgi:hypothetical protein
MRIKPLAKIIIICIITYILIWTYAVIFENQRLIEILIQSLGKVLLILFISGIFTTINSKTPDEKLKLYLKKYFRNKLSENENIILSKGISLIYQKNFNSALILFQENKIENYSQYFESLINIMSDKEIDTSIAILESLKYTNNIDEGFGDLYYLLAKGYKKKQINDEKLLLYRQNFEKYEKLLFANMTFSKI